MDQEVTPIKLAAQDAFSALNKLHESLNLQRQSVGGFVRLEERPLWSECRPHWNALVEALAFADELLFHPPEGDGLLAVWLRRLLIAAVDLDDEIDKRPYRAEVMRIGMDGGRLHWLAVHGRQIGYYIQEYVDFSRPGRLLAVAQRGQRRMPSDRLLEISHEVESWWEKQPALPPENNAVFKKQDRAQRMRDDLRRQLEDI